jgi:hypothetical protein
MRAISSTVLAAAALAAAALAGSSAFAQGDYRHHNFCLLTGSAQECAYDTFAQCEAAKRGNADTCMRNGPPVNH